MSSALLQPMPEVPGVEHIYVNAGGLRMHVAVAGPESGEPVRVLDGRYGPYVTDGATNASLPKGLAPDALTMAQAQELLAARAGSPKKGGRARKAKAAPSRARKSSTTGLSWAGSPRSHGARASRKRGRAAGRC